MGLIRAAAGSIGGALADQWREFFYCEALPADVIATKGQKRADGRSSNTRGTDNIISNGSIMAVADGQCMLIVEQGKVIDVCAEPGEYIFDIGGEPSLFGTGTFGENALGSLKSVWERFKFGGQPGKDTRVYYFNTKEIIGNKYGTQNPVPFRVLDANIGLDIDISVRCNGEYSYKVTNPILFYVNVCGNIESSYVRGTIDSQLKSELLTALQPAFARISAMGIRYSALPAHTMELSGALNEVLSSQWRDLRGVEIVALGVNSITASKEDEDMIKELQRTAVYRNPNMAGAALVGAQADAMRAAASNESGAMMGFMGMGFAQQAGGMNAQNLYAMGQQPPQQPPMQPQPPQPQSPQPPAAPAAAGWVCSCGHAGNTSKFCSECGKPQPQNDSWTCSCGAVNKGKFCSECAKPKPAGVPQYRCDKCGWEPEDKAHPPKFCPECGDPFDDGDLV